MHVGKLACDLTHPLVLEGRDASVLLWIEPLKKGLPGMHDECVHWGFLLHFCNEFPEKLIGVELVHSQPAFTSDWNFDAFSHSLQTFRYQIRVLHQTGSEASTLHLRWRTATVQINLVVSELLPQLACNGQLLRIIASQLKSNWFFDWKELQLILSCFLVEDWARMDHFCVEERPFGKQSEKHSEVAVSHVHHGSDLK